MAKMAHVHAIRPIGTERVGLKIMAGTVAGTLHLEYLAAAEAELGAVMVAAAAAADGMVVAGVMLSLEAEDPATQEEYFPE